MSAFHATVLRWANERLDALLGAPGGLPHELAAEGRSLLHDLEDGHLGQGGEARLRGGRVSCCAGESAVPSRFRPAMTVRSWSGW